MCARVLLVVAVAVLGFVVVVVGMGIVGWEVCGGAKDEGTPLQGLCVQGIGGMLFLATVEGFMGC